MCTLRTTNLCSHLLKNTVCFLYNFQYANSTVWIHYEDGSQLGVKATSPKYVIHVTSDGQSITYYADDELPPLVCNRIANDLPVAMEQLHMLRTA